MTGWLFALSALYLLVYSAIRLRRERFEARRRAHLEAELERLREEERALRTRRRNVS